jgi:hypothetical protein
MALFSDLGKNLLGAGKAIAGGGLGAGLAKPAVMPTPPGVVSKPIAGTAPAVATPMGAPAGMPLGGRKTLGGLIGATGLMKGGGPVPALTPGAQGFLDTAKTTLQGAKGFGGILGAAKQIAGQGKGLSPADAASLKAQRSFNKAQRVTRAFRGGRR